MDLGEIPTHVEQYVQVPLSGILFEVPSKYVPLVLLGSGAYGTVCVADNSETGERVAIKKIGNAFRNQTVAKRTLREIMLVRRMNHQNVIAIKDIIRPPQQENFNDVYIVCELMNYDLKSKMRSEPLTEDNRQYILYQLMRGLKYVHSANVLHRDLKPENLLLKDNFDLKIADFGLARTIPETNVMTKDVVTRWYRAPELLLKCSDYTEAIDIWSVGCIFGEIVTGKPLFRGTSDKHQLQLIIKFIGYPDESSLGFLRNDNALSYIRQFSQCPGQNFAAKFSDMSEAAVDLLEKMLVFDPNRRITVDEALCHCYLKTVRDIKSETVHLKPLNFDFEQPTITTENIKQLILGESVNFNPDP